MTNSERDKFIREKDLTERLVCRLGLDWHTPINPNCGGKECGIDVLVPLSDGRRIGVQVTVLDPHPVSGRARAEEKRIAGKAPVVYGGFAQNSPQVYLDTFASVIKRKITIAEQHDFAGFGLAELWLLVSAGIPEHGAVISTMVMTPWLHEASIETATGNDLQNSKYDRCFFLPILGAERAFYSREKHSIWRKTVLLDDIDDAPHASYIENLVQAAAAGDDQEIDRLCDEEVKAVLHELRQGKL